MAYLTKTGFLSTCGIAGLPIKVGKHGEEPITHWVCQLEAKKELYEKLLSLKKFSEIEISNLKEFLESKNLKLVRK